MLVILQLKIIEVLRIYIYHGITYFDKFNICADDSFNCSLPTFVGIYTDFFAGLDYNGKISSPI